jgi:tetratricopeptide (TPR) repeat protein/transcriptional regulator with XRE-family HTH domain
VSEEFARQLRAVRDATGRSLRELEKLTHVSNSSLSRYFAGQSPAPWPVVVKLCQLAKQDPRPLRAAWEQARRPRSTAPARNDLPLDTTGFAGRRSEVAALLRARRVVAIDGMAGVGKTALAVHVAHQLIPQYPDGRLFLDLFGYTPGQEPVPPGEALRVLLTALEVPATRIPEGVRERAALWRSELAFRRAVVVLDNAVDAAHVEPLLPGAGSSLMLITSRQRLVELDGVPSLSLDVLPPADAAELFATAVGDARGESSPAVDEVLRQCGHLPLALRVAAARMRHRPAWTADTLVERLRDGDLGTAPVFAMSVNQLDAAQQRMFRLLGQVPCGDLSPAAAAALSGRPASALLDDLVDAHLLEESTPNRYRQHDLLREYARSLTPDDDLRDCLTRLLDYYVETAAAAVSVAHPELSRLRGLKPTSQLVDPAWLDVERANLLAVASFAADHGWPQQAQRFSTVLYPYLDALALHGEALTLATQALDASLSLGDPAGEAQALLDCVTMNWRQGRYDDAEPRVRRALELVRAVGDRYGEARAVNRLGNVWMARGSHEQALDAFRTALDLFRQVGDRLYEAVVLGNLGSVYLALDRLDEAHEHHLRALALHRSIGSQGGAATALGNLGQVYARQGVAAQAREYFHQALAIDRELGYRSGEADVLNSLGELASQTGDPAAAVDDHETALAIAAEIGNRHEYERASRGLASARRRV